MGSSEWTNPAPHRVLSICLPNFLDSASGPLHSIIEDYWGNVYFSDEFNHRVISVKSNGSIRWHRLRKGKEPGEFYYPRGLSLGSIQVNNKTMQSLAVADGWNQRVQFFDTEGNQLGIWTHAGSHKFGEIADVKFVSENRETDLNKEKSAFWYILDRGNSCLFKMGIDGALLGQIGRYFPPSMNVCWAMSTAFFSRGGSASAAVEKNSPIDYLSFPERILGNSQESLFLSEAGSTELKQVLPPHLVPLRLNYSKTLKWVAADSLRLLAWDRSAHRLTRRTGKNSEGEIAGISCSPIPSNCPLDYFWLQAGGYLEKWKWDLPTVGLSDVILKHNPWMEIAAAQEIRQLDVAVLENSVKAGFVLLDDEIKLGDSILAMSYEGIPDEYMDEMSRHAIEFSTKCTWLEKRMREALHHWSLGQLHRRISGLPMILFSEQTGNYEEFRKGLEKQIALRIREIQKRLDALCARLSSLSGNSGPIHKTWISIAEISKSNLEHAKGWIASWSGINYSTLH